MSPARRRGEAPCTPLAAARSALVDGALDLDRQERMLVHLVSCRPCREDVKELRRLREALRSRSPGTAPTDLTQRLVSIAGAEAHVPLWSRPFRRTAPGFLTSRRRTARLRRTAAVVLAGATVAGAAAVGYAAAPANALVDVRDPAPEAQAEFRTVLTQFPLASDALIAVLSAAPAALTTPVAVPALASTTSGRTSLLAGQARAAMVRAIDAADETSYRGVQAFRASSGGRTYSAIVEVQANAGDGTRMRLLDRSGQPIGAGVTGPSSSARVVDETALALLERNYTLVGWSGARAAGRAATLVEAQRGGRAAARWWVDDASGIVLAQQNFDRSGRTVMQVGFTNLQVSRSSALLENLPRQLTVPATSTVLTLSMAPALDSAGWVCQDWLAGLSLVRLRSDSPVAPTAVHTVYSDGLATVSVFEQRGELTSPLRGSRWDSALAAYRLDGTSRLASWQSGARVFTVVTDGSSELLASAVASLPHEAVPEPTTMERIRAGWARLLADMKG